MDSLRTELAAVAIIDFSFQRASDARPIASSDVEKINALVTQQGGLLLGGTPLSILSKFSDSESAVTFGLSLMTQSYLEPYDVRVVIHVGKVIYGDGQLGGDGVEATHRLLSAISAGGLFVSRAVFNDIQNSMADSFLRMGEFRFRNFEPIEVFRHKPEVLTKRDIKESQVSHWLLNTILLTFLGLLLSALYFGVFGVETKNQLGDLQKFRERVRKAIHRDGDGK